MRETKAQKQAYFYQKMSEFGFTFEEADKLRRIEMTLHRWAEAECNGEIQREEAIQTSCRFCEQDIENLAPFPKGEWRDRGNNTTCPTPEGDAGRKHEPVRKPDTRPRRYYGQYMDHSYPIADREAGALKRLNKIMAAHPEWTFYHQGDPRGCALYIIRKDNPLLANHPIDSVYSQGFGVCF